jgi:DDE superfamily endonuclease
MLSYEALRPSPEIFLVLTGLTKDEFDRLLPEFGRALQQQRASARHTRRGAQPRRRAAGAGHPHALDLPTRLLLVLTWLRIYPTYELLGWLFGLEKSNAWQNTQDGLAALESLADFRFERPAAQRKALASKEAVMAAFPQVKLIIDSKEQPFHRPQGWDNQKPFYSGKKKRHTIKTQVAVQPDGTIGAVSGSVPGSVHDLTLLEGSGLLGNLDAAAGEGAMFDRGYVGVDKGHPGLPVVLPEKAKPKQPLTGPQRLRNKVVGRYRVVVEHVMAQLCRFQVLKQAFRSVFGRHRQVMRAVAMLVNRRTEQVPLKTYAMA